mgnify:FL=1
MGNQSKARLRLGFWRRAGASGQVLKWLREGVSLPFKQQPQEFSGRNPMWTARELEYWERELLPKLNKEGAVREVPTRPRYCAGSYLVAKRSGGYRHIVNLRPLNRFLCLPRIKYESLSVLKYLVG